MKKILILLVLSKIFISCISVESNNIFLSENDKNIINLYIKKWELKELEQHLKNLEKSGITKEQLETYYNQKHVLEIKKMLFNEFNKELSTALKKNDIDFIEKNTMKNLVNDIKLDELKKIDFSYFDIYTSEGKFYEDTAKNYMLLNYLDETLYFSLKFIYSKSSWKLASFSNEE